MSPRAQTPAPLSDRSYWRRLLAAVHPDRDGGDADLFLFLTALQEHVERCTVASLASSPHRCPEPEPERVPFDPTLDFAALTRRALRIAGEVGEPYAGLLWLLADCLPADHGRPELEQRRGADYRRVAAAAHLAGLSYGERQQWYRVAESIPLSDRHAKHLLDRLGERRAA